MNIDGRCHFLKNLNILLKDFKQQHLIYLTSSNNRRRGRWRGCINFIVSSNFNDKEFKKTTTIYLPMNHSD